MIPADLLSLHFEQGSRIWQVAYTLPRQEKALARDLYQHQLPFYLPCSSHRVRVGRQIQKSTKPLFPSYVITCLTESERALAYKTRRIQSFLPVTRQDQFLQEIRSVQRMLSFGEPLTVGTILSEGEEVWIREGPLQGVVGRVSRNAAGFLFVVDVEFFGQSVGITLPGQLLGLVA
jgi:transcriptional antiterminator RfaH